MLNQINKLIKLTLILSAAPLFLGASSTANAQELDEEALIKRGKLMFLRCRACHSVEQDGAHKVGPNLFGIIGAQIGTKDGFVYSDVMTSAEFVWDHDKLDKFIEKPTAFLPKTKMAFVGLRKEQDRKALVAYINSVTSP